MDGVIQTTLIIHTQSPLFTLISTVGRRAIQSVTQRKTLKSNELDVRSL